MKKKLQSIYFIPMVLICMNIHTLKAQSKIENPFKNGLTFYLGADSSLKIRSIALFQFQARYLELNDGSLGADGQKRSETVDLGINRLCIGANVNYKRLTFYYLLGNSGINISNGRPGNFFTYEGWLSYEIVKKHLNLGIGQSLFNGISRMSSLSSSQLVTVDPVWVSLPTVAKADNIGRQFHIFATGNLGGFEYRAALVRPFTDALPTLTANNKVYDFPSDKFGAEAYVNYQFFDKEDAKVSARGFSYLGAKRILNIGAGFEYQPKATASMNEQNDTTFNNTLTFATDVYLDLPFTKGAALSLYSAFYIYNFGKNYLRSLNTVSYFKGGKDIMGAGVNEYITGTGNAFFTQIAYMFAKRFTSEKHKLQIYATVLYKNFDGFKEKSFQPGGGINYYLAGHNAKICLQYHRRPYYGSDLKIDSYKNNILLQFQISF